MHAFHGCQVSTATWLFIQILPLGTSRMGCLSERNNKSTNSWRNNRVTQHDEAALLLWCSLETVYNISYGMDWNETPSSNETTQLSVERIWTMTLTAGLQRLVETWKQKRARGAESGSKMYENGKGSICYYSNYSSKIHKHTPGYWMLSQVVLQILMII